MIFETIVVGAYQANCYVLACVSGGGAIIIDPGDEAARIRRVIARHSLTPELIVNTHGHIDHIGGNDAFGVPVYVHERDLPLLRQPELNLSNLLNSPYKVAAAIKTVKEGDTIESGGVGLEVLHIPGHTPGGIALLMRKPQQSMVFTGDSLFRQGIGRTDFPGADETALILAIKTKLLRLPDDTIVYPGHGPASTIGDEKRLNPFLK
jgi:glyoxylase-like metal-dependent hydrolase (beta-lactamase superfamily II)